MIQAYLAADQRFCKVDLAVERGIFNLLKDAEDQVVYLSCKDIREFLQRYKDYLEDIVEVAITAEEEGVKLKAYSKMPIEELKIEEAYGELGDFLERNGVNIDNIRLWVFEVTSIPYHERHYFVLDDSRIAFVDVEDEYRFCLFKP